MQPHPLGRRGAHARGGLHFGPDTPSRLMLPIVPVTAVTGFEAPAGQCPYASMRCIPGS